MATHARVNGGHAPTSDAPTSDAPSSEEHVRALYEQAESQTASAFEALVAKPSFGRLLAMTGENVAAMARITSDAADLVLRNLRVAGRADITRLAQQLHRTEDKLESVLQEVESLRDQLATADEAPRDGGRSTVKPP
jgi:HPt (histidine-containing phosphotransfer) domain-containing protein